MHQFHCCVEYIYAHANRRRANTRFRIQTDFRETIPPKSTFNLIAVGDNKKTFAPGVTARIGSRRAKLSFAEALSATPLARERNTGRYPVRTQLSPNLSPMSRLLQSRAKLQWPKPGESAITPRPKLPARTDRRARCAPVSAAHRRPRDRLVRGHYVFSGQRHFASTIFADQILIVGWRLSKEAWPPVGSLSATRCTNVSVLFLLFLSRSRFFSLLSPSVFPLGGGEREDAPRHGSMPPLLLRASLASASTLIASSYQARR